MVGEGAQAIDTADPPASGPPDLRLHRRGQVLSTYLDASALVKAFLAEEGSELVLQLLHERGPGATSRIAYGECQAALARARREKRLTQRQVSAAQRNFDQGWEDLVVVELDSTLTGQAGRMTHEFALPAGDAIHLASAVTIAAEDTRGTSFACWDGRLWDAASHLALAMVPASRPS